MTVPDPFAASIGKAIAADPDADHKAVMLAMEAIIRGPERLQARFGMVVATSIARAIAGDIDRIAKPPRARVAADAAFTK